MIMIHKYKMKINMYFNVQKIKMKMKLLAG